MDSEITGQANTFNGKRIARRTSTGTVYYYFEDHLGTSRVSVQAGQNTACYEADFYPFGGERVITNTCPPTHKFTGKERDSESGLDDFGARMYASTMGRFTSADPITVIPPRIVDPQQLNLYAYVRNSPLVHVDPTGMVIDTSRLSEDELKKWQQIINLANQKDAHDNYVNQQLHDVYDKLQSDSRTFFIENNSNLGADTAGKFTITKFDGASNFSEAKIELNFKVIKNIKSSTPAEYGGWPTFGGTEVTGVGVPHPRALCEGGAWYSVTDNRPTLRNCRRMGHPAGLIVGCDASF